MIRRNRTSVHIHTGQDHQTVRTEQVQQFRVLLSAQIAAAFQQGNHVQTSRHPFRFRTVDPRKQTNRLFHPATGLICPAVRGIGSARPVALTLFLRRFIVINDPVHGMIQRSPGDHIDPPPADSRHLLPDRLRRDAPPLRRRFQMRIIQPSKLHFWFLSARPGSGLSYTCFPCSKTVTLPPTAPERRNRTR